MHKNVEEGIGILGKAYECGEGHRKMGGGGGKGVSVDTASNEYQNFQVYQLWTLDYLGME